MRKSVVNTVYALVSLNKYHILFCVVAIIKCRSIADSQGGWLLPRKSDRTLSKALGGGQTLHRLKKAVKQVLKPSEDRIQQMLERITSIQACKDASLTGDKDLRLLAICRLGEWENEGFESLEIAMNDDDSLVRTAAAGMFANTGLPDAIQILERHLGDNSETVRDTVSYALDWLTKYGKQAQRNDYMPKVKDSPSDLLIESDLIPFRTTDTVLVINDYTTYPDMLEYGITISNEGKKPIYEVCVKILAYPRDCMKAEDALSQTIESIEPEESGSLIFGFSIHGECVEGEIITSVTLVDDTGEDLSAKAGNVFVRSIFEQFLPHEITADEFIRTKSDMKQWNREHTIDAEARKIYKALIEIFQNKNLRIFQNETIERDNAFMGVLAGCASGRFTEKILVVTLTVVGAKKEGISKLRIDTFSENGEILHSAASDVFETILRDLGVIELD